VTAPRRFCVCVGLLGLLALPAGATEADFGVEKQRDVARASRELEQVPFGAEAYERRAELFRWWKEVPEIKLRWCPTLLLDVDLDHESLQGTLLLQALLSAGAFQLEQRGSVRSREIWIAGVAGALRTYRVAREELPELRNGFLDELEQLERAGRLGEYVESHAADCE